MDADGREMKALTQTPELSEVHASWSPDGESIAFTAKPADSPDGWQRSVYVVPAAGGKGRQVTASEHNDLSPGWLVAPGGVSDRAYDGCTSAFPQRVGARGMARIVAILLPSLAACSSVTGPNAIGAPSGPLPSWNNGATKRRPNLLSRVYAGVHCRLNWTLRSRVSGPSLVLQRLQCRRVE